MNARYSTLRARGCFASIYSAMILPKALRDRYHYGSDTRGGDSCLLGQPVISATDRRLEPWLQWPKHCKAKGRPLYWREMWPCFATCTHLPGWRPPGGLYGPQCLFSTGLVLSSVLWLAGLDTLSELPHLTPLMPTYPIDIIWHD